MRFPKIAFLTVVTAFTLPVSAGWFDGWQPQQVAYTPVYIRASAANVRSAPSTASYSHVFGTFSQNTPLQVLHSQNFGSEGTWYFVRSKDGREGWVNGHLLSRNKIQTQAAVKPAAPQVTATPKPAPASPAVTVPPPAKPADTLNHCVSEFNSNNAKDKAVMAQMSALAKGELNSTGWNSKRGTGFSFSSSGGIVITVSSLPPQAVQQLATTAGVAPEVIQSLISANAISFNAKVCVSQGNLSIKLNGMGTTEGKTGFLALKPDKNGGFRASGEIAGSKISESFTKASR